MWKNKHTYVSTKNISNTWCNPSGFRCNLGLTRRLPNSKDILQVIFCRAVTKLFLKVENEQTNRGLTKSQETYQNINMELLESRSSGLVNLVLTKPSNVCLKINVWWSSWLLKRSSQPFDLYPTGKICQDEWRVHQPPLSNQHFQRYQMWLMAGEEQREAAVLLNIGKQGYRPWSWGRLG